MTVPVLPGVTTRSRARDPSPPASAAKRSRLQLTPSTVAPQPSVALEQWLDDVANVDISLSISVGQPSTATPTSETESTSPSSTDGGPAVQAEFSVSIPVMLTRVLQSKLAIDPCRLTTTVQPNAQNDAATEVYVALAVKGREEPIAEAIEGGLTPRKAFLRSAPHISRVASRLQDCMRQIFGMKDFVVKVE